MAELHINGARYELADPMPPGSPAKHALEAMLLRLEDASAEPQMVDVNVDGQRMLLRLVPGRLWAWGLVTDQL